MSRENGIDINSNVDARETKHQNKKTIQAVIWDELAADVAAHRTLVVVVALVVVIVAHSICHWYHRLRRTVYIIQGMIQTLSEAVSISFDFLRPAWRAESHAILMYGWRYEVFWDADVVVVAIVEVHVLGGARTGSLFHVHVNM